MSCEQCRWWSSSGSSYSKGYCSYRRSYTYCDDTCRYEESSSSGGCFLTTACVKARGLGDKCYELETLRTFRDGWMINQPGGMKDITEYYTIAPKIVDSINDREDSVEIWNDVYSIIAECVCLINNGKDNEKYLHDAYHIYKDMTLRLKAEYLS